MNIVETSQEFDVLYNNIKSDKAPGVDEYEKSVFSHAFKALKPIKTNCLFSH